MTSAAVKCSAVALVLQLFVCIAADLYAIGTRVGDFNRPSDVTSNDNSAVHGLQNRQRRSLLQSPQPCDINHGCDNGFTCVSGVCIAPTVAPAPAPAMQPQIGSTSGPSMTPAGTSKATPAATAASVFSTATIVPAITLVATLSDYATVAAFNTTEQTRFCATLEDNILRVQKVVANCTITNVVLGSVKVSNTLAFTGSDSAAAETARGEVATALARSDGSGSANYFGTSFGSVTVSDVKSTTTTNPQAKSGAISLKASLVGMVGGLTVLAMTLISA